MLHDEHGPNGVDAEGLEGVVGVDLGGRLLGVEDAGYAECETEVVGGGGEHGAHLGGGGGDAGFVWMGVSAPMNCLK